MIEDTQSQDRMEDLRTVLTATPWRWHSAPFPHVTAVDVFKPRAYEAIVADFRALMDRQSDSTYNGRHDFFGSSLFRNQCGALEIFLSPAWGQLFADLFDVHGRTSVTAGVHRHRPGSRNGFAHNDIYPEHLAGTTVEGEMRPGSRIQGKAVRAVAVLFYLNNGGWRPGDGGETGLYWDWKDDIDEPAALAPPRDNTLFAFGCNPHSYHSFRTNQKRRDSVISFVYRPLGDYLAQWGDEGLRQYAEYGRQDA